MPNEFEIPLGWPYPKRKKFLFDLSKEENGKYSTKIKFQGQATTFQVYSIQIDLPKFRLTNGRTQAAQEEYLAKNPQLGNDFFTRDLESDEAQSVQYALLWKMVENTLLYPYFKDVKNTQDEPLILSYDGFVVNGNRRLCVMRKLFYEDKTKYAHFAHIEVVVLPFCSPKDIDELEAYLQIQPDIKQNYSWIAKACMLRARQQVHRYSNAELAKLYDMEEKEIQSLLSQLSSADVYLSSRGKDKQYDLVEQDQFAFKQILVGRQQLKQQDERDVFTDISYAFIDGKGDIEGRLYEWIPDIKENLPAIINQLKVELPVHEPLQSRKNDYDLFGNTQSSKILEPLIQAINKSENHELLIETVVDVIEGQKEKKKQKIKANAVLKEVSNANTSLKTALNYLTPESTKEGVNEQLLAIEESIKIIREWISSNA